MQIKNKLNGILNKNEEINVFFLSKSEIYDVIFNKLNYKKIYTFHLNFSVNYLYAINYE